MDLSLILKIAADWLEVETAVNLYSLNSRAEVTEGDGCPAMETRAGCECLAVDQCTHPVWLLTLSLTASSLFKEKALL